MTMPWPVWFRLTWPQVTRQADMAASAAPRLLAGLLVLLVGIWIARKLRRVTVDAVHKALPGTEAALPIGQIVHGGTLILSVAVTATLWGFGLGNVVTGLGVSGVVIGFALKDILENYLAGLMLMVGQPFRLGQRIRSGDVEGIVTRISTRSTTLQSADGTVILVPNARLLANPIHNSGTRDLRREHVTLDLPSSRDIALMRSDLLDILRHLGVPEEPAPEVLMTRIEATVYGLEIRFWASPADSPILRSQLLEEILKRGLVLPV
ncbi:MAG: mechanosensitive ion channel family protein [Candidatus Sericytochromatia bacterium]|nr:mechanosensitive ion channel family protein [Candidatus Sericytochromatia bacterium]